MKTYVPSIILIVTVLTLAAGADGAQANANRVQPATIARHDANRTIGNCHLSMQCPSSEQPRQMADGTGPIQTCRPGANCGPDDQLRQVADGTGPIQTCRPGANCGPDDQLRQVADGTGPIQTCRPGANCGPDDQLRLTGRSWERVILGSLLPESRQASTA